MNTDHIVMSAKENKIRCRHCGDAQQLQLPIPVYLMAALADAYIKRHAECEPLSDKEYSQ